MLGLLVYLAMQPGHRHSREAMAELLWPDLRMQTARFNLRHTFFHLREALGEGRNDQPFLLSARDWVGFNLRADYWIDTAEFIAGQGTPTSEPGDPEQLASLYRGEFMSGFSLPGCQEFERWLQIKREDMRRRAAMLLEQLSQQHESAGRFEQALKFADRLTSLDSLNEASHGRVMKLHAMAGRPGAAKAQYDTCCALLREEMGTVPSADMRALCDRIVKGEYHPPSHVLPLSEAARPLSQVTERRQVTVLYCELALAGSDDAEEAAERLRSPLCHCHGLIAERGAFASQLHGGALLAYFGYPNASERAATDAVEVAQAILANVVPPAVVRCAVHTGVIVTSRNSAMPDLAGTTSTLAMRLAHGLEEGGIALSEATARLVVGSVRFHHVRSMTTGSVRPLNVYSVGDHPSLYRLEEVPALIPFAGKEMSSRHIEELWRDACASLTEGDAVEDAIESWRQAGALAARRSCHLEAVSHYTKALDLQSQLPAARPNTMAEFRLNISLGLQLALTTGFGSREVRECFARAYGLCRDSDDAEMLFPVVHGQWLGAGSYASYWYAEDLASRLRNLADVSGRDDFSLVSYMATVVTLFWLGRPAEVASYSDAAQALISRTGLHDYLGPDPRVYALVFSGLSKWMLGYMEEARHLTEKAMTIARDTGYGDSKCLVLTTLAILDRHQRRPARVLEHSEILEGLARAHNLPLWSAAARCLRGWAMAVQGQATGAEEARVGVEEVRQSMAGAEGMFGAIYLEALAALGLHTEVTIEVEPIIHSATKRNDGHVMPELYRLKGESLLLVDLSPVAKRTAEACFGRALEIARRGGARMLELRAAMSLFRLKRDTPSRERLVSVAGWFGEHSDVPEVADALRLSRTRSKQSIASSVTHRNRGEGRRSR